MEKKRIGVKDLVNIGILQYFISSHFLLPGLLDLYRS